MKWICCVKGQFMDLIIGTAAIQQNQNHLTSFWMVMASAFIKKFKGTNPFLLPSKFLFQFGSLHSNSSPNPFPPSMLVTNLDDALNLFDKMILTHPLPSVAHFNHLLHLVTKMTHFSVSLHLYKQMCLLDVPVNEYSMNIAIKCCCQLFHTNEGFAVLNWNFKRGIIPNVCTFNTLLNGLVMEDRIVEAERLFNKLIKQKLCEPDVVMYSTMIKGLCKFGNNVTALALLRLMEQTSSKPDVVTYSTIIDSLCKDNMTEDAFNLFKEMVIHKGILPNVITYNSLIHGLCKFGHWDEAKKMLIEMQDQNISPNVQTFTVLVDAFCREGLLGEAKQLFVKMDGCGCPRDNVTYRVLLRGYLKNQHYDDVEMLLKEMDRQGYFVDATTLSLLLEGIAGGSLNRSMHKLISKLVPKELINTPTSGKPL